jgi:hypothetical protein
MAYEGFPDPYPVLFALMELHLPLIVSYLEKLADLKVLHPDQYLVHPAVDLGKFLLPYLPDLLMDVVDPMTKQVADNAKLKILAQELKGSLCASESFGKLSVAVAKEKCMTFLEALEKEFPVLEGERRRLSSLLPGIQNRDGIMSTWCTTALMREVIASAAGSKSSDEEEDTAGPCPILGGKARAIYAQSLRPMYERKEQGILQTSSGTF